MINVVATNDQHIRVVPASWPGHLKEPTLVVSIEVDDALENSEIQVDKIEMLPRSKHLGHWCQDKYIQDCFMQCI